MMTGQREWAGWIGGVFLFFWEIQGLYDFNVADLYLVGGLEHESYFSIDWEQSSQLTNMFQRG